MLFSIGLYGSALICLFLHLYTYKTAPRIDNPQFNSFQRTYLLVYLLAIAGDWLQGPHVYALYESYGMSKHRIELLFIAGFGSSLIFGTFIGSIADKYGRKANVFLYAILYGCSCVTKHFNNFYILALGRFFGGVATSILFSAFESWLVCEHNKRGFKDDFLSTIFVHASLGNSLVAIGSGIFAQVVADAFGYVAPFDLALLVLTLMSVIVLFTWTENYGDRKANMSDTFRSAIRVIRNEPPVFCLGLIQSFFEGAMYTFVLMWTPTLNRAMRHVTPDATIPHGFVFATFMIAIMIGSSVFKIVHRYAQPESFMRYVLLISAFCLSIPVFVPTWLGTVYLAFVVFEFCVGIFWPSMGMLRGRYVPEAARSTTMNLFRIPLNLIVILVLMQNVSAAFIFTCCVGFLLCAVVAQFFLFGYTEMNPKIPSVDPISEKTPLSDEV
ncbi:hypothetical protein M3Y94_00239000 [Aphelenchoides besseyi]|nr:hypothetical protein M3Y94_00239000 [Aphelenchoides besseyi]KAI6236369.1 hypothetical protein M3Y95_00150100 [Aphelenchoides besseyi]